MLFLYPRHGSVHPFFIIFQVVFIEEFLRIFLSRNLSLFIYFIICCTFQRDEFIGKGQAKLVSCVHSLSCVHAQTWYHLILSLQGSWAHTLSLSTTPCTPSPYPEEHCRIQSLVSTTIISDICKIAILGGGGGRADLRRAGLVPLFSAQAQACFCGQDFYSSAPYRALSILPFIL